MKFPTNTIMFERAKRKIHLQNYKVHSTENDGARDGM